jgi:hypothetical protein
MNPGVLSVRFPPCRIECCGFRSFAEEEQAAGHGKKLSVLVDDGQRLVGLECRG